jgi:hypothetical protein
MTSTASDAEQQMLLQSFTPSGSQAVHMSLCDEEALSATGEFRDTPIWISDNDTDTEDEGGDEGKDFDDPQSCRTPMTPSFADPLDKFFTLLILPGLYADSLYTDNTGTKHCPTELEAAIGMDATPAVSPAQVEGDTI